MVCAVTRHPSEPWAGGYYGQSRPELVALLPRPLGRVLDVGCGEGRVAAGLRAAGASWITGVEIHAPSAERAARSLDEVFVGRLEEHIGGFDGVFDTILLYDVLEHLPDPASALVALRGVAAPGARVHVSLPNARHWSLVRDLALRGTFGYTDAGHRDRTHLRWFTRRDIVSLLEQCGWHVERVDHLPLRRVSALASRLTSGLTAEFLVYQWFLLARSRESAPEGAR
ncbi:Methyltransferase domain [Gaiella occulta]|uniref:Methyltransferase domain n=1 Tax=Gaiella occulta TaxID=1002870 RepID=A0A7M2YXJ3_9ACTN|nr:Methyltransferase domain [Gaiella occulta]